MCVSHGGAAVPLRVEVRRELLMLVGTSVEWSPR
jgi:hypothetical protein